MKSTFFAFILLVVSASVVPVQKSNEVISLENEVVSILKKNKVFDQRVVVEVAEKVGTRPSISAACVVGDKKNTIVFNLKDFKALNAAERELLVLHEADWCDWHETRFSPEERKQRRLAKQGLTCVHDI